MNLINNIAKCLLVIALAYTGLLMSCQKMSRPALPSDYPKDDIKLPDGPLRFYLPFDSTNADAKQLNIRFADSISTYPSFFPDASTQAVPGVRGTAYQGSYGTFLHYYSANDFGKATSFTMSLWLRATIDQKDHNNADGVLAVSSTTNFWGNLTAFADHEVSTSDSGIFKIHFANGPSGDNWNFAGYSGNKRFPHMYDGNWHLFTFTYDAGTKTGTMYYDGAQFDQQTNQDIAFDGNANQVVVGGFQEAVGLVDTYANNSWMSGWPGAIDNVRLYNTALSAADVMALYNNKQ
jgi:hypothetical protein